MKRVVVAGAGISGLSLAFELERLGVSVLVLEGDRRAGGKIETDRRDGYICERGPASYLDRHNSITPLARRLGIEGRVLPASDAGERRLVVANGRLHDTPLDAAAFLRSRLLPFSAKLRMLADLVLPRGPSARGQEESVTAFATRRLGALAGERLLQPLVSGLYAGDPDVVSLPAAFPLMAARWSAGIGAWFWVCAPISSNSGRSGTRDGDAARLSSFVTGLDELTTALASRLGDRLRLGVRIVQVERAGSGFRSGGRRGWAQERLDADALVLAIPAHQACRGPAAGFRVVRDPRAHSLCPGCAGAPGLLRLGAARVRGCLWILRACVRAPEDPRRHLRLGHSFPAARRPGFSLFSVRMGGARHPETASLPDEELTALAHAEFAACWA
jgi:oxygen-dependent protoporphyrinogen oxidase